jgi:hypothetical protein
MANSPFVGDPGFIHDVLYVSILLRSAISLSALYPLTGYYIDIQENPEIKKNLTSTPYSRLFAQSDRTRPDQMCASVLFSYTK